MMEFNKECRFFSRKMGAWMNSLLSSMASLGCNSRVKKHLSEEDAAGNLIHRDSCFLFEDSVIITWKLFVFIQIYWDAWESFKPLLINV